MLALYPDEIAREAAASALGPALDMGPGTPPPADLDRILDAIDNPVARLVGLPERYRATLLDVREVTVLDDGRVGAVVVRRFGDQPDRPPVGEYIVFQRVEGRWLMVGGGEETALGGDLPAAASPTP
jgi:hypothetical protein